MGIIALLFGHGKKLPTEQQRKAADNHIRECGVCGTEVGKGFIQCPVCGSGIFNPPKTKHMYPTKTKHMYPKANELFHSTERMLVSGPDVLPRLMERLRLNFPGHPLIARGADRIFIVIISALFLLGAVMAIGWSNRQDLGAVVILVKVLAWIIGIASALFLVVGITYLIDFLVIILTGTSVLSSNDINTLIYRWLSCPKCGAKVGGKQYRQLLRELSASCPKCGSTFHLPHQP